jgi:hypothetical protein
VVNAELPAAIFGDHFQLDILTDGVLPIRLADFDVCHPSPFDGKAGTDTHPFYRS